MHLSVCSDHSSPDSIGAPAELLCRSVQDSHVPVQTVHESHLTLSQTFMDAAPRYCADNGHARKMRTMLVFVAATQCASIERAGPIRLHKSITWTEMTAASGRMAHVLRTSRTSI